MRRQTWSWVLRAAGLVTAGVLWLLVEVDTSLPFWVLVALVAAPWVLLLAAEWLWRSRSDLPAMDALVAVGRWMTIARAALALAGLAIALAVVFLWHG